MAYRLKPHVQLVCVKDQQGLIRYHYANPLPDGPDFGPIIPWLSAEQAAHLLRCNMVERIDDSDDDGTPADRVTECAGALDSLAVPSDSGAPRARQALRDAGHRFGNDIISAAVKTRKALSATGAA